ncbi:MAG: pilus assembly protein TadG [Burkholderiales bacterium]|nr:pilus assembly protein TadG [Burkholderiales bacterium]
MRARPSTPTRRGAVSIIVGLSLVVLLGFVGLAIDGGHLYLTKTELQNAADACALAASYELTGAPAIAPATFTRADAAGVAVAERNNVNFQGSPIAAADVTLEYSDSLTGGWTASGSAPADAQYVRCTIQRGGIQPYFMQVLGAGNQTVSALATATLAPAQTNCAIPLGMCSAGLATDTPPFGLTPGQWINGRFSSGGGLTGSFNWIDFSPPNGGETELANQLTGSGVCSLNVPTPVGQTGLMGDALAKAWNTRFGLYQGSYNLSNAPPDFTGYAYTPFDWPSQSNALADFRSKRTTFTPYGTDVANGNTISGLSMSNAYNPVTTAAQHQQSGADRRLAVSPIINCADWATSQTVPIRGWACILMLHPIASAGSTIYMEYEGTSNTPGSPCASSGITGDANSVGPLVPSLVQ